MVNDHVSVFDSATRACILRSLLDSVVQDPTSRLPLLLNQKNDPPSYDLLSELDMPFMVSCADGRVSEMAIELIELL